MLKEQLSGYEMFGEVRGLGLLNAIEFKAPRSLKLRVAFETLAAIHPAVFGQMLVMRLFHGHGMLNRICGNNFMVLKVSPPLTDGGKPPRCLRPGNRANNQTSCTPSAVFGPKRLASRSAR